MVEPIRRKDSFESESLSPASSDISDLDLNVSAEAKRSLYVPLESPPPVIRVVPPRIDLDALALGENGIGYKAANLVQLGLLASSLGVVVPPFKALSHKEIMSHILKVYPQFIDDYRRFVEILRVATSLTDQGKGILARIRAGVEGAFSEDHPFEGAGLSSFLTSCESDKVIVRSSGREDSSKVSNAGVYLSIPFTDKTITAVSLNIGKVVASYFSDSSIGKRLSAKDEALLDELHPFIPVLIQEEIMEKLLGETDEEIPRSGVMFVKAGFLEISIGLGDNEGIVSSSVPTDSYRARRGGKVRAVIRRKTRRFRGIKIDGGKIECRAVPCHGRIVEARALSPELAEKMRGVGEGLYDFKQEPLDSEVITQEAINLVQNRPLKICVPEKLPSYIQVTGEVIQGEVITDGGCYVRNIRGPDQVLVCRSITEAYQKYPLLSPEEQAKIEGVIIQETAPRTSHEAVFFTAQGLPVIVIDQITEIVPPYFLDPQQGLLAKEGIEHPGHFCFPIPLQLSLEESSLIKAMHLQSFEPRLDRGEFIKRELGELDRRVGAALPHQISTIRELREQVEVMKSGTIEESEIAAKKIVQCIYKKIQGKNIAHKSRIELVMVLDNIFDILKYDPLIGGPRSDERLWTVRLLESCLFQTGEGIVGGFSFVRSLTDIKSQRVGSEELRWFNEEETLQDIPFIKMKRYILREDLQAAWGKVVFQVANIDDKSKEIVKNLFYKIEALGGATEFINVTFVNLIKEFKLDKEPVTLYQFGTFFERLVALSEELQPTLDGALQMHQFVLEERANIGAWSTPDHVQKNIERIQKRVEGLGFHTAEGSIAIAFERSSPDGKLILLQALRGVVECYDEIIKSCTGSQEYPSYKAKATDFLQLLLPYRGMTKAINQMTRRPFTEDQKDYCLPLSLERVSEQKAQELLRVSRGFDVSEIVQDVAMRYTTGAYIPATRLEEKFTLFHRTMERDLSALAIKNGFTEEILPSELSDFVTKIRSGDPLKRKITSMRLKGDLLQIGLSIPLRDHGATISLDYHQIVKTIEIKLSIFGGNERNRWDYIGKLAHIIGAKLGVLIILSAVSNTSLKLIFSPMSLKIISAGDISELIDSLLRATFSICGGIWEGEISILEIIPDKFQSEDIVLEEVSRDGMYLSYVSDELKHNSRIIIAALSQNIEALKFVPREKVMELLDNPLLKDVRLPIAKSKRKELTIED